MQDSRTIMRNRIINGFMALCLATAVVALCSSVAGCGGGSGTTPPQILSIVTTSLPDGTIGSSYTQNIQAAGGVAPFTWSVSSGALPHSLALAVSTGTISGTPDQVQSSVAFTIQVTDARSQSAKQSYTVNIKSSPTVAQTQSGAVRGVVVGDLIAFRGIPYAAPPVGNLRWRPPQPPMNWTGIRDASSFGNLCPQIQDGGQLAGNEDCLTLNIFIGQPAPSQKLPVMVFFHGGGNGRGGADGPPFDTPPLATHGVIVVTAEYRLGLLGFFANSLLTTEGGGSSGNYGLLDMIAVLSWVRQNIAAFGGNPAHVMLFGQSAGSFDVQALLFAPAAQGLFSVAGMESNAITKGVLPMLVTLEALDDPFVSSVGCDKAADVLVCLRAVPADTVVNGQAGFRPFVPNIGTGFLPVDPFTTLQQNGSPVPLLIGSTREEAAGFKDDPNTPLDATGYTTAIHTEFDPFGAGVADQVLTLYPASAYDTPEYALIAVDSDFDVTCEVRTVARAATGTNRPPVWRYLYTHRFENDAALNAFRAFHRAELFFVFGNLQIINGAYTPTAAELTFADQMMGYWTRFAATGDPNGSGATQWLRYDATTDTMLQLDDTQMVINGYHNTQCDYLTTLPQP
jgi:para-nitrobenzyl esterase